MLRFWFLYCAVVVVVSCGLVAGSANAYLVSFALTLEELQEQADVIVKVTAVDTTTVDDDSFRTTSGYGPHETVLDVVSVMKGRDVIGDAEQVRFRHFAELNDQLARMYMPQHYSFEEGRTYIVSAKIVEGKKHLRQIWDAHRSKEDQGVLLAGDARAHQGQSLKDVYWHELNTLLKSDQADDVTYAIDQLGAMTGMRHDSHQSFVRSDAVTAIVPLLESRDDRIAEAAIRAIAAENAVQGESMWALFQQNPNHFPGHGELDTTPNRSAKKHAAKLIQFADSQRSNTIRARAVIALCNSDNPDLKQHADRWSRHPEGELRAAAALLLADFADDVPVATWERLLEDKDVSVRGNAIRALALGKVEALLDRIDADLDSDDDQIVADAAAAILAYPIELSHKVLESRIEHPEFGCLFVNVLALGDVAQYADRLGQIVRTNPHPKRWWGGRIPWAISWTLLFQYVREQPAERVRQGDFDSILASLESPVADHPKSIHFSSTEPRDLYRWYVQRGLKKRASEYRKTVIEKTPFDMKKYLGE